MEIPHYRPHPVQRQFMLQAERQSFMDEALTAVRKAAEKHYRLTVDDVWPFVPGLATLSASDLRMIGNAMKQAAKEGIITQTSQFIPSTNRRCHKCPRRVWLSLIYEGRAFC